MGVSKLSAKAFSKVNYSFKGSGFLGNQKWLLEGHRPAEFSSPTPVKHT